MLDTAPILGRVIRRLRTERGISQEGLAAISGVDRTFMGQIGLGEANPSFDVLRYDKRTSGEIISTNFQLHPPRGKNSDEIRNECGNLLYPLLLCAEHDKNGFIVIEHRPEVLKTGRCRISPSGQLG